MGKTSTAFTCVLMAIFSAAFAQEPVDSISATPNPFATSTTLYFELNAPASLTLTIYSAFGIELETVFTDSALTAGAHSIFPLGNEWLDGIYFAFLRNGNEPVAILRVLKNTTLSAGTSERLKANSLYPNPTSGLINIPGEGEKFITVTNLQGQTVSAFNTNRDEAQLRDLPAGTYIVKIRYVTLNFETTSRIVKIE